MGEWYDYKIRFANNEGRNLANEMNVEFYCPSTVLCTDNAAMIGCAAYYDYLDGKVADLKINAIANLSL